MIKVIVGVLFIWIGIGVIFGFRPQPINTWRLLAGAAITGITVSWLIS